MIAPFYEDDSVTLYHGDCREILPTLGMVDHVITDPPFSAHTHRNAKSNRGIGHGVRAIDFEAIDFEAIDFEAIDFVMTESGKLCSRWLVAFMDWRHIAEFEKRPPSGFEFIRFGVWVKTNPMPQISADRPANGWDGIAYLHSTKRKKRWNGGGAHGNFIHAVINDGNHPTPKPLSILRSLVLNFTDPGETILDPFAGSGTTLVAAKALGRKAIGIEKERKYCDVIVRRLSQEILPLTFNQPKKETDDGRNEQNLFAREPGKASRGKRARDDEAR